MSSKTTLRFRPPLINNANKVALFNFARALSKHFRTEGDKPIKGFPNTPEALEAFVDDWEGKNHGYSPVSRDIVGSFVHAFGDRWFPHPFKPIGRWVCIEALEDSFLEHVRIKPLKGVRKWVARGALNDWQAASVEFAKALNGTGTPDLSAGSQFAASWLTLREAVDSHARSEALVNRLDAWLSMREAPCRSPACIEISVNRPIGPEGNRD